MTDPQGLWAAPEDVRERVSRLLCDLVAIPSYGGQEGEIVQYLVKRFARQAIPCRVSELDGKPINVVAEIGQGPRAIILNSHVDTVPPGDPALWQTDPLTPVEKDGRIYGRGAGDAKGCLTAMIVAFEALATRRTTDSLSALSSWRWGPRSVAGWARNWRSRTVSAPMLRWSGSPRYSCRSWHTRESCGWRWK